MSETDSNEELLSLLGDATARRILMVADGKPVSAEDLDKECSSSLSTIYRRIEDLEEHGLLRIINHPNPGGNSYALYQTRIEEVTIVFNQGRIEVDSSARSDAGDRLADMWEDIR